MNIYELFPINLLIRGGYWLLETLGDSLGPSFGAQSAAVAIVLLTMAVRALLIPVGISQVRASVTRQRLAPQLAALNRKYGKNPEVLQRKTMELYRREKASPFAGCLPVLAQMPVLMAVYGLFILPEIDGHRNELLSHGLFGVPLGDALLGSLSAGSASWATAGLFLTIMALIAVVAQASRRLLMPPQTPASTAPQGGPDLSGLFRAMSFLPFMTAVIAAFVPLAAALYLLTTTTWTLLERLVLTRLIGRDPAERG